MKEEIILETKQVKDGKYYQSEVVLNRHEKRFFRHMYRTTWYLKSINMGQTTSSDDFIKW